MFAPCIGIMCIDMAKALSNTYGHPWYCYLASSYAKHLEAAGAMAVPIW